ncbi:serine hydrolase domain-containing protein [Demequina flava]|uniref:serine hydrolase domain-containing protein n=1 Tax=Demequina flava TaxID=1095025 RepID=UPI0007830FB5|nr:serine hydrolase domain-containing protein [Demequina flava]
MPIVPVYSIAKTYTAAAALLTWPVGTRMGDLLPEADPNSSPLSLESVLSHRSGLNDYFPWDDYRADVAARRDPWPASQVLARATVGESGQFAYSNIGYLLVRLALERAHGESFFDVLNAMVLTPLSVDAQRFETREDWGRCSGVEIDESLRAYHPGWVYPGTFIADPADAAAGIARIMRGDLGPSLAEAMKQVHLVGAPDTHPMQPGAGYGLGLMTSGDPVSVVGHGGQGPGLSVFAAASADGKRSDGDFAAGEGEDLDLIARCVEAVLPAGHAD